MVPIWALCTPRLRISPHYLSTPGDASLAVKSLELAREARAAAAEWTYSRFSAGLPTSAAA